MYKIGYTTGVFDLFHIGHLNILRRAKEQCEYLIVGVSTDELVMEYKNKKPIIPFKERIEIVKSIKYVDEVVPQENLDKVEVYKKIKYNVLFQGDDWKKSPVFKETVKELKEGDRDHSIPIHSESIHGISCRSFKETLIRCAIFVGNDWKGTSSWKNYEEKFEAIDVEVVYLEYTEGTSSTKLSMLLDETLRKR